MIQVISEYDMLIDAHQYVTKLVFSLLNVIFYVIMVNVIKVENDVTNKPRLKTKKEFFVIMLAI